MIQKLAMSDLRKGMYIVDMSFREKHPGTASIYSVEGFVVSDSEVRDLLAQGFTSAFVDMDTSIHMAPDNEPVAPAQRGVSLSEEQMVDSNPAPLPVPKVEYHAELPKAQQVQAQGLDLARYVAQCTTVHSDLPIKEVQGFMGDVVSSVQRNESALLSLTKLKTKDSYTFTHCVNVAVLAVTLSKMLGIKEQFLSDLALSGFFHDIGKLFILPQVLHFPGKLTPEQFKEVQCHVERGHLYLSQHAGISQTVLDGVYEHQERFDGKGYPCGKQGMEISLAGRIMAVADVYDALTSRRSYKPAMPPSQALSIMYKDKDTAFSPGFVEFFVKAVGVYPPGSKVLLSNQCMGVVVESTEQPLRPKVVLLADSRGARVKPVLLDLGVLDHLSIADTLTKLPFEADIEEAIAAAAG